MNDGSVVNAVIAIDTRFVESSLLVKESDVIKSYSPSTIDSFIVADQKGRTIMFESVKTKFVKNTSSIKSLLKRNLRGEPYSLYSKYIQSRKNRPAFIFSNPYAAKGLHSYLRDDEVLLLEINNVAYQISKPKRSKLSKDFFKVDKWSFYRILGNRADAVKEYIKSEKKNIKKRYELIDIIKYVNSIEQPIE